MGLLCSLLSQRALATESGLDRAVIDIESALVRKGRRDSSLDPTPRDLLLGRFPDAPSRSSNATARCRSSSMELKISRSISEAGRAVQSKSTTSSSALLTPQLATPTKSVGTEGARSLVVSAPAAAAQSGDVGHATPRHRSLSRSGSPHKSCSPRISATGSPRTRSSTWSSFSPPPPIHRPQSALEMRRSHGTNNWYQSR